MVPLAASGPTHSEIPYDHRLATLAARHAGLERAIADEWGRPAPDTLCLTALKRRKLRVKEQIVRHLRAAGIRRAS